MGVGGGGGAWRFHIIIAMIGGVRIIWSVISLLCLLSCVSCPSRAALPEHTAKPAPGGEGTHQGTPGPESHCGEPQSLRSSGGPGEEEGRQSSAQCRLQAPKLEDCW